MFTENKPSFAQILAFLQAVDDSFPIPLSEKQPLSVYAAKLYEQGTICALLDGDEIISMTAGYTDNVTDNSGYISMVATLEKAAGRGYAKKTVTAFLEVAAEKKLSTVHLYAVRENLPAMRMYQSLGFTEYRVANEPRPNDVHLIYTIPTDGVSENGE